MSDQEVTLQTWGLAALLLWLTVLALGAADSIDGRIGIMGLWALILTAPASCVTFLAVRGQERGREYQRGLDSGLEAANIIRLDARPARR